VGEKVFGMVGGAGREMVGGVAVATKEEGSVVKVGVRNKREIVSGVNSLVVMEELASISTDVSRNVGVERERVERAACKGAPEMLIGG
jgi:hypothetical protein